MDSDNPFRFIVHLKTAANLEPESLPADLLPRRQQVVRLLQETAASSQAALIQQLQNLEKQNQISEYRSLWIINGIAASGTAGAVYQIAQRPEVERISLDVPRRYFDPPQEIDELDNFQITAAAPGITFTWGIERVKAAYVWEALGIDGSGVTVGIMDTGVDWTHPDLMASYRGNMGAGNVNHAGNWYYTRMPTMTEPFDSHGHGTHVAGTAVGQNGIGVAPGAKWIAVGIADQFGLIYDSDVHSGFQWMMAPNGNPSLAPDIINNSWGGSPYITLFLDDIAAVNAAGIINVFSAGNNGPFTETINSPASYTSTLAVGASDDEDRVVWFSSRGPSPLTSEQKPWLVAPGAKILSSLPQGNYGYQHGTSMSTPHVAGAIALLLSANPSLSQAEIMQILANTAVPIDPPHPNNDSGYGRLDTYAAVDTQVQTGFLQGRVTLNNVPHPNTSLTVTTLSGASLIFQTDGNGVYRASLKPGQYDIAITPFGMVPSNAIGLVITANQTTTYDFQLTPLPSGVMEGHIRQTVTNQPLQAVINLAGTGVSTQSDANGRYQFNVPEGQYQLEVAAHGYRLGKASLQINAGLTTTQDFWLDPAPTILLVDSGRWYYDSYAGYYQSTLNNLDYDYDLWQIHNPYEDLPDHADLKNYEYVIWSFPLDSPGFIGANSIITDYLRTGGNLLVSGQHVGVRDGQGLWAQQWWFQYLKGQFLGKTAVTQTITGTPGGIFDGLSLSLNGGTGAGNQVSVDKARPFPGSLTQAGLHYEDGGGASLHGGHCEPYRIVYLGFGLEGVSDEDDREALLEKSFDFFQSPRVGTGALWGQSGIDDYALPGEQLVYTVTLRNLSETITDTFQLSVSNSLWQSSLVTQTLTIGSCGWGQTVLKIDVPSTAPRDMVNNMRLTAVSTHDNSFSADLDIRHKVPGSILFVDDDKWYDRERIFLNALDTQGISYDVWDVGWAYDRKQRGSPPTAFLKAYDFVLWYTGYDWFRPVTPQENQSLTEYLDQGGRLFLTSQDFMYYHHSTSLARDYFGVIEYRESITPTQVYGGDNPALPVSFAGPVALDYGLYINNSDGLVPGPSSTPFLWNDQGMAAGVATAGDDWRSIFLGFPFETLPTAVHVEGMNAIMGWLSDLGDSTFEVDSWSGAVGVPRTYSITLRNMAYGVSNHVWMTNSLPSEITFLPGTITGGALYDPATRVLRWDGILPSGGSHIISYQASPDPALPDGYRIDNQLTIYYGRHDLSFNRSNSTWINAPDLSPSVISATTGFIAPRQYVTYTVLIDNNGPGAASNVSATIRLPDQLIPVSNTFSVSQGSGQLQGSSILWQGGVVPGDVITVSLVMSREITISPSWLGATAVIDDGISDPIIRNILVHLPPYRFYFPWFPI